MRWTFHPTPDAWENFQTRSLNLAECGLSCTTQLRDFCCCLILFCRLRPCTNLCTTIVPVIVYISLIHVWVGLAHCIQRLLGCFGVVLLFCWGFSFWEVYVCLSVSTGFCEPWSVICNGFSFLRGGHMLGYCFWGMLWACLCNLSESIVFFSFLGVYACLSSLFLRDVSLRV